MKQSSGSLIDIESVCKTKGSLFIYFVDINNTIVACNALKADFFRDLFGCENIIGQKPLDFLQDEKLASAAACYGENPSVIKKGVARQCYHSWSVKGLYRLDLLTFKLPVYDNTRNPLGVLVTSHFLNKIALDEAYALGFTKRESECLLYLFEGYTAKEIAKATKLSPRTVEGYVDNMKLKQRCATTSELLLKALQNNVKTSISEKFALNKLDSPAEFIAGHNLHRCVELTVTKTE